MENIKKTRENDHSANQIRRKRENEIVLQLVKDHKKTKERQEKLEFESIDKNITSNLIELNKIRKENEEKVKEKKRLEIVERMKRNE